MENSDNHISVRGSLSDPPLFSHENHGIRFLRFTLQVPRLSGAMDFLPVIAPESLVSAIPPDSWDSIRAEGQIRSHNIHREDGRHLQIFLFAAELAAEEGPPLNTVYLKGTICRSPILRRTPMGRDICDLMLAVPRAYHRADYLPCILWGSTAQEADQCDVRDTVEIWGRLQSRNYSKVLEDRIETRTAYEISAMTAQFYADPD